MRIVITRDAPDGLTSRSWTWWVDAPMGRDQIDLIFDAYSEYERPSTRHKQREVARWRRDGIRAYETRWIETDAIEIPEDVVDEAADTITKQIKVYAPGAPRPRAWRAG